MMYGRFAAVYDRLMADVDYDAWADYVLALLARHEIAAKNAADTACGTGNLTLPLRARGLVMTGVDQSMEMLAEAATKARARGFSIPFVRQDIRKLTLHRPMDAVFCACDGVNYLVRPQDVQAFFGSAYQALRPGGALVFDVSTEYKLRHRLGNRCRGYDGDEIGYIWQNHWDEPSRTLQMDLAFFTARPDGAFDRFRETHFQRAHSFDELATWLRDAGFATIDVYGDRTFTAPRADEKRAQFIAVKR